MADDSGLSLSYEAKAGTADFEMVTGISGLAELEEALTGGSKRAVKKFLLGAEKKAAKKLKDALSEEAPYDKGDLSEDIHISTTTSDGVLTCRVGPSKDTFYGMFQEFGAPEANVPAQHWMENTAVEHQDEVLQTYMECLSESLQDMKK
jgi:HK97 gp10 family phage protein